MARYSKKAGKTVEQAMRKRKRGALKSGRGGKEVTSRKQAIAIGLSEARKKGAKVPPKGKGAQGKKTGTRKGTGKRKSVTKNRSTRSKRRKS